MDALQRNLTTIFQRAQSLPSRTRWAFLVGGALLAALVLAGAWANNATGSYSYVFTNLGAEDSAEAGATLKAVGIPFRLEAGGAALAVPESRVHDARILLASSGIPRSSHVGFELFDKGDLGVSQFTQKVNLGRALEGELARTIGSVAHVRNARVHLTLPQTGLHKEDDHEATAGVVVTLQPGTELARRELAGVRHLVAAAVPGLKLANVMVMDGTGTVLAGSDDAGDELQVQRRRLEKEMEQRVEAVLLPVVGPGNVLARATAEMDPTQVDSTVEKFDPESVLRSERTSNATTTNATGGARGVAGAAVNQPQGAGGGGGGNSGSSSQLEETRNFEVGKSTTVTRSLAPRVRRVSIAVLINGVDGKPRAAEDIARLTELARRAAGLDASRGDQLELQSNVFAAPPADVPAAPDGPPVMVMVGAAAAVLALLLVVGLWLLGRRSRQPAILDAMPLALLEPGRRVSEIEISAAPEPIKVGAGDVTAAAALEGAIPAAPVPALSAEAVLISKAQVMARENPQRAALLLRAWLNADKASEEPAHGK